MIVCGSLLFFCDFNQSINHSFDDWLTLMLTTIMHIQHSTKVTPLLLCVIILHYAQKVETHKKLLLYPHYTTKTFRQHQQHKHTHKISHGKHIFTAINQRLDDDSNSNIRIYISPSCTHIYDTYIYNNTYTHVPNREPSHPPPIVQFQLFRRAWDGAAICFFLPVCGFVLCQDFGLIESLCATS